MNRLILPEKFIFDPLPRTMDEEISLILQSLPEVREAIDEFDGENEIVFTVIRNPYDLIHIWFTLNPGWTDFISFIRSYEHSHFVRDGKLLWTAKEGVDTLRYEGLPDALSEYLMDNHGIDLQFPKPVPSNYRNFYSPDAVAAVKERFGAELEQFEYEF